MRQKIPLLGGQSTHRIAKVKDQQTINWYPKAESPDAKSQVTLLPFPGLTKITTVNTGPGRANMAVWKSNLYGVSGNALFKMDTSDVVTSLGTLNTSAGWCNIAVGRDMIMITDGTNGYTYDGTTFAVISDADYPDDATDCAYLDGRFLVNDTGTDQFFMSAVEDATSWAALDFASAESSPDDIYAIETTTKDLYLFGDKTIQVYYNSGNADFPFEPYPSVIEYGIEAKYSLTHDDNGLYFLARKPQGGIVVVHINGFQGRIISDPDITWTINQLSTTSDAIGAIYDMEGESYYILTFPASDFTLAFNLQTGLPLRLKSYNIGRHRALAYGSLAGRQFCMDYSNAKLYELDFTKYTEDGGVIERYRRSQVIHNNNVRVIYNELVIDILAGVGNGDEAAPVIELRYSDDGGNTWSSWISQLMGGTGEYTTRCVWRRLGQSRGRIFEFRVTDPVEAVIIDCYADVELMRD